MTRTRVLEAVRQTVTRHRLLDGGETVLVAVSGGADSTALLHILHALAPALDLRLHVLHVDHGLRRGSPGDAEFVRQLAGRLGVPCDVAVVTVARGGSLEAAARAARYAALEAHADRVGAARIALGHTADDQAETVLMRLLEGSGVRGLAGIPAARGRVIRPLLEIRHQALVDLLRERGLSWVEDPSNQDPRFVRNRIRHTVLPGLGASAGGDVVAALVRVSQQARAAVDALDQLARRELAHLGACRDGALILSRAELAGLPRSLAGEVLRHAVARLGGRPSLRAWEHRGLARALASPPPRRPFRLGGVTVEVSGDRVRMSRAAPPALGAHEVPLPGTVRLDEIGLALESRLVPAEGYAVPHGPGCVAFDADGLRGPLLVRPRRRGDRFLPFGADGERRLKSLLIDLKIPRWDRDRVPLVVAGGEIVWIGGLRRGRAAPVTAATRRVLELALKPLADPLTAQ